ncbi:hypothetical protein [Terriglobus albidus]|uniref:hypothetical protein n=1 Tax=Terriglobus albidus TaxID=1592106 RepID=UPI0021E02E68|nr:hypothetical protein [Terriglobus albidus]
MQLGISADTKGFEQTLEGWERDKFPAATAKALNGVAVLVRRADRATMGVSFDRPTPYTMNSAYFQAATKTNLTATVNLKSVASKGVPPSTYLLPQVEGGSRAAKPSEIAFRRKGILPGGMFWVPGSGAKLNRYGNIQPSLITQIMSATGSHWKAGYDANRTTRSMQRNKKQIDIFVGRPGGGHGPLGVWQRMADGELKPLLIFVDHADYKVRLPFGQIAREVYQANFARLLNEAMRDMLILSPSLGGGQ